MSAPADARERVLRAIRLDGEPCAEENVYRWSGMAREHVRPTLDAMVADGSLVFVAPQPHRVSIREREGGYRLADVT